MIQILLLCALFVLSTQACGSNYVARTSAMRNQAVSYLSPSIAGQLVGIGSRSPCGERQCGRCAGGLAYSTQTRNFGHFSVTAHRGLLSVLTNVFNDMNRENPTLFRRIGTAGAVCCRLVKLAGGGCASSWSNHAFGSAIDLKIDGIVDAHGDGCVHRGLVEAAPFFQRYQLYWGAGFSTEDAMHFEVSKQLAQRWISSGIPNVGEVTPSDPVPQPGGGSNNIPSGPSCSYRGNSGSCIATGDCRGAGGQCFSSRAGANGCQSYPTDIQCCVNGASLLEGETGDLAGDEIEVEEDPEAPMEPETIAAIVVGILIPLIVIVAIVLFIRARRNAAKVDVFASVQNPSYDMTAAKSGSYTCATCQASFDDVNDLTTHVATHQ